MRFRPDRVFDLLRSGSVHINDSVTRTGARLGIGSPTRARAAELRQKTQCLRTDDAQVLFDAQFYRHRHADLHAYRGTLAHHFVHFGELENRQPHPLFDPIFYASQCTAAQLQHYGTPLRHFLLAPHSERHNPHPLFDSQYYSQRYPEVIARSLNPLVHYLREGAERGYHPHPLFHPNYYTSQHAEVRQRGGNPLIDFVLHGSRADLSCHPLFDCATYRARHIVVGCAVLHFLTTRPPHHVSPHVLFDSAYYAHRYGVDGGLHPLLHYLRHGITANLQPHPLFDPTYYGPVEAAADGPLIHYLREGGAARRDPHPLFRSSYYLQQRPQGSDLPLLDFLQADPHSVPSPHPLFDIAAYRATYAVDGNPLVHYLHHGHLVPHPLFDPALYGSQQATPVGGNPLVHYLTHPDAWDLRTHPLFDGRYYRHQHAVPPDQTPLEHFVTQGCAQDCNPNAYFDIAYYREHNTDVDFQRVSPLIHYMAAGAAAGRNPGPRFDTNYYLTHNPDCAAAGYNPLQHFLEHGEREGRLPRPAPASPPRARIVASWLDQPNMSDMKCAARVAAVRGWLIVSEGEVISGEVVWEGCTAPLHVGQPSPDVAGSIDSDATHCRFYGDIPWEAPFRSGELSLRFINSTGDVHHLGPWPLARASALARLVAYPAAVRRAQETFRLEVWLATPQEQAPALHVTAIGPGGQHETCWPGEWQCQAVDGGQLWARDVRLDWHAWPDARLAARLWLPDAEQTIPLPDIERGLWHGQLDRCTVVSHASGVQLELAGSITYDAMVGIELFASGPGFQVGPLPLAVTARNRPRPFRWTCRVDTLVDTEELTVWAEDPSGRRYIIKNSTLHVPCRGHVARLPGDTHPSVAITGWIAHAGDVPWVVTVITSHGAMDVVWTESDATGAALPTASGQPRHFFAEVPTGTHDIEVRALHPGTGQVRRWRLPVTELTSVSPQRDRERRTSCTAVAAPLLMVVVPDSPLGQAWAQAVQTAQDDADSTLWSVADLARCLSPSGSMLPALGGKRRLVLFPLAAPANPPLAPFRALLAAHPHLEVHAPHATSGAPISDLHTALLIDWQLLHNIAAAQHQAPTSLQNLLASLNLNVTNPDDALALRIEAPQAGDEVGDELVVRGWALTADPQAQLQLYLNDVPWPDAPQREARHDLLASQPTAPNLLQAGFVWRVSWHALPPGPCEVRVRLRVGSGIVDQRVAGLHVPAIRCEWEQPEPGRPIYGTHVRVEGWVLSRADEPVHVACEWGDIVTTLQPRLPRPDLACRFGSLPRARHCGFTARLPLPATGTDAPLHLRAWTDNGDVVTLAPRTVQRRILTLAGNLDHVVMDARGEVQVVGWLLAPSAAAQVQIRIHDIPVGIAHLHHLRLDLARRFNDVPTAEYCGFSASVRLPPEVVSASQLTCLALTDNANTAVCFAQAALPAPPPQQTQTRRHGPTDLEYCWETPEADNNIDGDTITVKGWVFRHDGSPVSIEIWMGGERVASAQANRVRKDVGRVFTTYRHAAASGFVAHLPVDVPIGTVMHLRLVFVDTHGTPIFDAGERRICRVPTRHGGDDDPAYGRWIAANTPTAADRMRASTAAAEWQYRPLISIVMPVYNAPPVWLQHAIDSVHAQWYDHWELCIVDDASTVTACHPVLDHAARDPRIHVARLSTNVGIVGASNAAARRAKGDFLIFLDQDDALAPHCLYEVVRLLQAHPEADVIYTDDDKIDALGARFAPQFKPDWSPDLLLSFMYMGHALILRRSLFVRLKGFRKRCEGSQDHDLALRASEQTQAIFHIPTVLYHWRAIAGSTATSGAAKRYTFAAGLRAVRDALKRRGWRGTVERPPFAMAAEVGMYRIRWALPSPAPHVSILIPTHNQYPVLKACIDSIVAKSTYANYEIIIIDDRSDDPDTLAYLQASPHRVVRFDTPGATFNFSRLINMGAAAARGEYLLILNNDTTVITADWIEELVGWAQRPETGVVGCRLLYPDQRVQHAGIVVGIDDVMAAHAFALLPRFHGGHLGLSLNVRNCSAVTFAAAMVRKDVYGALGGMDEHHFPVAYQDPEFCLRARAQGQHIVYTPYAELFHFEGYSKPTTFCDVKDRYFFKQCMGPHVDPFYNVNFSRRRPYAVTAAPVYQACAPKVVHIAAWVHNLRPEGAPNLQFALLDALARQPERYRVSALLLGDGALAACYEASDMAVTRVTRDFFTETRAWLAAQAPDVAYGNTLDAVEFVSIALAQHYPVLWHIHESVNHHGYFRHFHPHQADAAVTALARATALVFVSQKTAELYQSNGLHRPVTIIPNGVNLTDIPAAAPPRQRQAPPAGHAPFSPEAIVIGCVGTICPRKGQHLLVHALHTLRRDAPELDLHLVLVGARENAYLDVLRTQIEALGLTDRVRLVPETVQARAWYSAFDLFAFPSHEESSPLVILEAMACGLPIVAAATFGVAEQINNGENGLLFAPGDLHGLCSSLQRLLTHPSEAAALAERAFYTARAHFSFDDKVAQYGRVFSQLATTPHAAVGSDP